VQIKADNFNKLKPRLQYKVLETSGIRQIKDSVLLKKTL